jgi:acetyl esterase
MHRQSFHRQSFHRQSCLGSLVMLTAAAHGFGCSRDNDRPRSDQPVSNVPTATAPDAGMRDIHTPPGAMTPASRTDEPRAVQPRDPMAAVDADMKQVLEVMSGLGVKPIATLTTEEARAQPSPADAVKAVLKQRDEPAEQTPMAKIENRKIPTGGAGLDVRIYTPRTDDDRPLPVVVYFHGGGFVLSNLDAYDASPRALADDADAIVVSADYRRAPEHKFPTAHDDAFAAYQWVVKNAAAFGGDPKRIAVAGESAGGNLAANVAIMARDRASTVPLHALLIYPVAQTDMTTASYMEWSNAKPLDKASMSWFVEKYTRSPEDLKDSRLNLVEANLKGFPPTTIVLAEVDPLRSDGELLAKRLDKADVKVDKKTYEGVTHEFFGMGAVVDDARDAQKYAASRLEDAFDD